MNTSTCYEFICKLILNSTFSKNLPVPSEHPEHLFATFAFGIKGLTWIK